MLFDANFCLDLPGYYHIICFWIFIEGFLIIVFCYKYFQSGANLQTRGGQKDNGTP